MVANSEFIEAAEIAGGASAQIVEALQMLQQQNDMMFKITCC